MAAPSYPIPNESLPADWAAAVTPSDSTNFTFIPRALYIGTGGNISCFFSDGTSVTFTNVVSGTILPIRVRRVNATSTTASNIVALY